MQWLAGMCMNKIYCLSSMDVCIQGRPLVLEKHNIKASIKLEMKQLNTYKYIKLHSWNGRKITCLLIPSMYYIAL